VAVGGTGGQAAIQDIQNPHDAACAGGELHLMSLLHLDSRESVCVVQEVSDVWQSLTWRNLLYPHIKARGKLADDGVSKQHTWAAEPNEQQALPQQSSGGKC